MARLATFPGGLSPIVEELFGATLLHADALWSATLARFLADYFELGFHQGNGLEHLPDSLSQGRMFFGIFRYLRLLPAAKARGEVIRQHREQILVGGGSRT